jgi:hypothetical protein
MFPKSKIAQRQKAIHPFGKESSGCLQWFSSVIALMLK